MLEDSAGPRDGASDHLLIAFISHSALLPKKAASIARVDTWCRGLLYLLLIILLFGSNETQFICVLFVFLFIILFFITTVSLLLLTLCIVSFNSQLTP